MEHQPTPASPNSESTNDSKTKPSTSKWFRQLTTMLVGLSTSGRSKTSPTPDPLTGAAWGYPDPSTMTTGPTSDEIELTHRTRLVEHHEIVSVVPLPQGNVVMINQVGGGALIEAQAAAWDWAQDNDVDIETSEVRALIFDDERNEHALRIGVQWTVDVGHARDDEWTWSARWEHWRAWFASMTMRAAAESRVRFPSDQVFAFSDVSPRIVSALQDPAWDGEATVDGDRHSVVIPLDTDEPVKPRTLADPNLAGEAWADDDDDLDTFRDTGAH